MREIKFRAWDKDNQALFYLDEQGSEYARSMALIRWLIQFPGSYEVMQFTGLKDKNGKEIYEGDIATVHGATGEVHYDLRLGQMYCGEFFLRKYDEKEIEVIGNIYENSELLASHS